METKDLVGTATVEETQKLAGVEANAEFDEFEAETTQPVKKSEKKSESKTESKSESKAEVKAEAKEQKSEKKVKKSVNVKDVVKETAGECKVVEGTNDYKPVPSKGSYIYVFAVAADGIAGPFLLQQITDKTVCMIKDYRIVQFNLETGEERGAVKVGLALTEETLKVLRCNIKYNSKFHKKLVEDTSNNIEEMVKMGSFILTVTKPTHEEADEARKLVVSPTSKKTTVPEVSQRKNALTEAQKKSGITTDGEGNPISSTGKKMKPISEALEDLKVQYENETDPAKREDIENRIALLEAKVEESRKKAVKEVEVKKEEDEFEDESPILNVTGVKDEFADDGEDF